MTNLSYDDNFAYQSFGPANSWTWGNGQPYTRNFDSDGRLADYPLGNDTRLISYDPASRITAYSHNTAANNQSFDYDLADRLTQSANSTGSQTYQYDANGNRSGLNLNGTAYQYNTAATSNRLLTVPGPSAKTYRYDAAGNTISDGTTTFTWNAGGRLSKAATGSQSNTYKHNGQGERVIKSGAGLSNGPYRFLYDATGHLLGEYDKNNALRQETVWLGDTPIAVVKKDAATQQLLVYYIQADHLNTPRVILNTANSPVWRWDNSDAFGNTLPNEDPDGDGKKFEYNLRFPGQYFDKETGLHYNYYRDYDPKTGRYPQSDPIGLAGGLNTYGYVGGNPVGGVDPLGLETVTRRYYPGPFDVFIPGSPTNKAFGKRVFEACNSFSEQIDRMFSEANDGTNSGDEQDTYLGKDIERKLKKYLADEGETIERLKTPGGRSAGGYDLYVKPNGDIVVKPKGGAGSGEPTGLNINDL